MKARRSTRKSPKPIGLPDQPADDAPLAEWAAWCTYVGRITGAWKVIRCRPKDKRPSRSGWQRHATNDPEKIKKFWEAEPDNNIGLAIQPGFVAVDVDDWEVFEKLEGDHGELPATFEQRTANGGGHFIFATELDTGNSTGSLPKGIDKRRARKMRSAVKKIVRERFPRGATVYWEDQSGGILQHRGHSDPLPKVRHAVTQAATWVPASDINHVAIEATSPATDPVASLAVS